MFELKITSNFHLGKNNFQADFHRIEKGLLVCFSNFTVQMDLTRQSCQNVDSTGQRWYQRQLLISSQVLLTAASLGTTF